MAPVAISPEAFAYLSELVLREAAIVLGNGKEYLATSRLESLVRDEGFDGFDALVRAIETDRTGRLTAHVVDALTTNETLWFRDSHPFDSLQNDVIPELMKDRATSRSIQIWCAAASTGQEPYSLAMMLRDMPELDGWRIRIVATDISGAALERARAGTYSQMEMGRGLPAKYMVKYFTRAGVNWQINPEIRSMVEFRQFNLAGNWAGMTQYDLVLVRNVLIYFSRQTKAQIIGHLEKLVRPDGYLLLGSTESLLGMETNFERAEYGKSTYFRVKANQK